MNLGLSDEQVLAVVGIVYDHISQESEGAPFSREFPDAVDALKRLSRDSQVVREYLQKRQGELIEDPAGLHPEDIEYNDDLASGKAFEDEWGFSVGPAIR